MEYLVRNRHGLGRGLGPALGLASSLGLALAVGCAGPTLHRPTLVHGRWVRAAKDKPQLLVVVRRGGEVVVYDADKRRVVDRPVIPVRTRQRVAYAWLSPSGRYLTVGKFGLGSVPDEVLLLDRRTRRRLLHRVVSSSLIVSIQFKPGSPVVFSADERLMAFTGEVKRRLDVGVYRMAGFRRLAVIQGERPAFTRDGKWLILNERRVHAVAQQGDAISLPRVRKLLDKTTRPCKGSPLAQGLVLGRKVAKTWPGVTYKRGLFAVDVATGQVRYRLDEPYCPYALSTNQRTMLFVSRAQPRRLRIYDVTTGKRLWLAVLGTGSSWGEAIYTASVSRTRAHVMLRSGALKRFTPHGSVSLGSVGERRRFRRGFCFGHSPCGTTTIYPAFFLAGDRYLYARDHSKKPGRVYLLH